MKLKKLTFAFLVGILVISSVNFANAQDDNLYSVQAMFIHNFIKYTEWPSNGQMITVGVINNSQATELLTKKLSISSRTEVKNFKKVEEMDLCQIIFVPSSSNGQLNKILERVKGKPILVVTENQDMVRKGAGISFKIIDLKMKFQMNQEVIKSSGLKISNTLIALAIN